MLRLLAALVFLVPILGQLAVAEEEPTAEMMSRWVRQLGSDEWVDRDEASRSLEDAGTAALTTLFVGIQSFDPEVSIRSRHLLIQIVRSLQPPEDRVRAHVRDALQRLTSKRSFGTGDPEYQEIIQIGRPAIPALVELLGEGKNDAVGRTYAGAALAEVCEPQDVAVLIDYLSDSNVHVRIHVGNSISELTGESYDYDSAAGPQNWSEAKASYRAWWKSNGDEILEAAQAEDAVRGKSRKGPRTRSGD